MGRDAAAILLAAGQGARFGGAVRKQYLKIRGKPLVWWSLKAFAAAPSVREIVIVVPAMDVPSVRARVKRWGRFKVKDVVSGGTTRAESVRRGLIAVTPGLRWIAVHDAVRPLVTPALIEETIVAARRYGAAIAACQSKDTVKIGDARAFVTASPPRESVWLAQTPQTFDRAILEKAHRRGERQVVTDDAQLVERIGVRVKLVKAPPENMKVTVPMDLPIARSLLGRQ